MTVKIAINGFGRMGRLWMRAAWGFEPTKPATLATPNGIWGDGGIEVVHINEPNGTSEISAHLLAFDSVHGRWPVHARADDEAIGQQTYKLFSIIKFNRCGLECFWR